MNVVCDVLMALTQSIPAAALRVRNCEGTAPQILAMRHRRLAFFSVRFGLYDHLRLLRLLFDRDAKRPNGPWLQLKPFRYVSPSTRGAQRPFLAVAPVQTDKTKESLIELTREFKGILSDKPVTPEELKKTQVNETLRLPGAWETAGRVAGSVAEIVRFSLPDDYFQTYPDKIRALTLPDVEKAAHTIIHPDRLIWVVVGDRAKIESGIRELNMGELHLLDADGNPVE